MGANISQCGNRRQTSSSILILSTNCRILHSESVIQTSNVLSSGKFSMTNRTSLDSRIRVQHLTCRSFRIVLQEAKAHARGSLFVRFPLCHKSWKLNDTKLGNCQFSRICSINSFGSVIECEKSIRRICVSAKIPWLHFRFLQISCQAIWRWKKSET